MAAIPKVQRPPKRKKAQGLSNLFCVAVESDPRYLEKSDILVWMRCLSVIKYGSFLFTMFHPFKLQGKFRNL